MTALHDREPEGSDVSTLWSFLAPHQDPEQVDAIFVFGGVNLSVPEFAATLYQGHYAPIVLVSGGSGSRTHLHFDDPEADVFVQVLKDGGVPDEDIVIEPKASNTGENVQLGMAKLLERIPHVSSLLLVATPFIMRRCLATFEMQYPHIQTVPCPPLGSFEQFVDRPFPEFVQRLVAEVERLDAYARSGYIAPVEIPPAARDACTRLRAELGDHLGG